MCGIAGFANLRGSKHSLDLAIKDMTDIIAHRGPDGQGHFSDGYAWLGNRRLAIIDIPTGKQPMSYDNQRYWITFNGEIYNYIELKKELIAKGRKFITNSDTEVILAAYATYGPKAVTKFNGMFAFAIYDTKTRTLFATRDRFGIKPLYYHYANGRLLFGSEIKSILKVRPSLAKHNPEGLSEYLTFQFTLGEKTLFKDIKKLEPAHYLIFKNNKLSTHKYWEINFSIDTHHTEAYYIDQLKHLIKDSVKLRLRSDVPVGAYLSGGLDSSTVATIAASYYPKKFQTFSGRFNQEGFDETNYAKLVSKKSHSQYNEITMTPKDFTDHLGTMIYHMDEPAGGPGLFPQFFVSRLASKHLKVVLGGQGGDEIFGGYARYLVAYLEATLKGAIFESQKKIDPRFVVTFNTILPGLPLLKEYTPLLKHFWSEGLFDSMSSRYFRLINRSDGVRKLISPKFMPSSDDFGRRAFDNIFTSRDFGPLFNRMTYFDLKTLLPALLQVEDRMSMASSLEARTPLLDHRIIELAATMPATLKFKKGQGKYILRQAAKGIIPTPILKRKDKMGFPVPLTQWSQGPLKDFIGDTLLGRTAKNRGLYDTKGVSKIISHEKTFDRRVWGLLNLEIWFQTFIDKKL